MSYDSQRLSSVFDEARKTRHTPYKGTDGSEELALHCLFFGESTADQNRVVCNLMRDLMSKTC